MDHVFLEQQHVAQVDLDLGHNSVESSRRLDDDVHEQVGRALRIREQVVLQSPVPGPRQSSIARYCA